MLLRLLLPVCRRFRRQLLTGLAALLVSDMLYLTIPRYLKIGVDELAQGAATGGRLLLLSCLMLLTAAVTGLLRYLWRTQLIGLSRHLETDLRERLFGHVLSMDQSFFDRRPPGEIMAHATNDLAAVQMGFGMGLAAAADVTVMSSVAVLFMLRISPSLTLTAALPLPLLAVSAWLLSRELHRRFERVQEQFGLLTEFARNTLVSIRLIKSCTREEQQIEDFERLGREYVRRNMRTAVMQGLLLPVAMLTGSLGTLLVLHSGGRMVIGGVITIGDFVAFITYFAMLAMPLTTVGWAVGIVRRGLTSLARIGRLLAAESALERSLRTADSPAVILQSLPHISLRRLRFAYPGTITPALSDIDLEIGPGVLGITGRTGSGKSTLCRLLVRQYPVEDGACFFAGHDVNSLDPALIRRHVSYVGRNTLLFSGTAGENISLAKPEAAQEAVEEAAKLAGIHDEIMAMSDGYQTRIGEKGLRLSGGQKQRVALARALLADRPVLIIDDALSALDAETGEQVFAALRACQRGRTLVLVSHQVRLFAAADQVLLLDQGRIADHGSHEELLARNPYYQEAARRQQGKEEDDAQLRLL
ncbi:MAG: ABC transporter ATP-binding protein [Candidatus Electronema sp. V4]|uniref:ABC transporter ATP-binding protein n=1 Tax=Candidatus Electronema sp. V4 TaxID=3454756 RepID=UPI00405550F7